MNTTPVADLSHYDEKSKSIIRHIMSFLTVVAFAFNLAVAIGVPYITYLASTGFGWHPIVTGILVTGAAATVGLWRGFKAFAWLVKGTQLMGQAGL